MQFEFKLYRQKSELEKCDAKEFEGSPKMVSLPSIQGFSGLETSDGVIVHNDTSRSSLKASTKFVNHHVSYINGT